METIFENGYLKPEFVNPNYRGLVGWPCYNGYVLITVDTFNGSTDYVFKGFGYDGGGHPKIPQFTPADIPPGELCWVLILGSWYLRRLKEVEVRNGIVVYRMLDCTLCYECVPFLIAETAEIAEQLKNWSRQ